MNVPAADPDWGWWIVWYFYLGGIAAGAYFLATLANLFGRENDRRLTRAGYFLASPLMAICGILLIVDLGQPMRFWQMLFDHDSWLPHLKVWSPMSLGAWAVLVFSGISFVSWMGVLAEAGWLGRFQGTTRRLQQGVFRRLLDWLGVICGAFIASYTGTLLTATNQPVWSDSPWIATLFLASSVGTGVAAIKLFPFSKELIPRDERDARHWSHTGLDALEPWAWLLEIFAAVMLLVSLGPPTLQLLFRQGFAVSFLGGALGLGILVPAVLRWWPSRWRHVTATVAAISVLTGGFLLRYTVLAAPRAIRASATGWASEYHPLQPAAVHRVSLNPETR
jgi:formate-dependent nitrite reductase membrane component NrfD